MEVARQQANSYYQGLAQDATTKSETRVVLPVQPMRQESVTSDNGNKGEKRETSNSSEDEPKQHELEQEQRRQKAKVAYVETSLDDLIYSDSGEGKWRKVEWEWASE